MENSQSARTTIWDIPDDIIRIICDAATPLTALSLLSVRWRGDPEFQQNMHDDVRRHFQRHKDACRESPTLEDISPDDANTLKEIYDDGLCGVHLDYLDTLMPDDAPHALWWRSHIVTKPPTGRHNSRPGQDYLWKLVTRVSELSIADIMRCPVRAVAAYTTVASARWALYCGYLLPNDALEMALWDVPLPRIASPIDNAAYLSTDTPEEECAYLIAIAIQWYQHGDNCEYRSGRDAFARIRDRHTEAVRLGALEFIKCPQEMVQRAEGRPEQMTLTTRPRVSDPPPLSLVSYDTLAQWQTRDRFRVDCVEAGLLLAPDSVYHDRAVCDTWIHPDPSGHWYDDDSLVRIRRLANDSGVIFARLVDQELLVQKWLPPLECYPEAFARRPLPRILWACNPYHHIRSAVLDCVGWQAVIDAYISCGVEVSCSTMEEVLQYFVSRGTVIDRARWYQLLSSSAAAHLFADNIPDYVDICTNNPKAAKMAYRFIRTYGPRDHRLPLARVARAAAPHFRALGNPGGAHDYVRTIPKTYGNLIANGLYEEARLWLAALADAYAQSQQSSAKLRDARLALSREAARKGALCIAYVLLTVTGGNLKRLAGGAEPLRDRVMDDSRHVFDMPYADFYQQRVAANKRPASQSAAKRVAASIQ